MKKTRKKSIIRKIKPQSSFNLANALILLGSLLLILWGVHRYTYNRSLSLSDALLASYKTDNTVAALPIHISLGTHISLPIVEAGKSNGVWAVSQTSANHVHNSALPGEKGISLFMAITSIKYLVSSWIPK